MAGVKRPMSQMRKLETKEALFRARKRILKYLVLGFLKQEGLFHSAETFASEAALTGEYEICDNIDLDIILQEGLFRSAESFASEAALTGEYEVCDNIDLDIILQILKYLVLGLLKQEGFFRVRNLRQYRTGHHIQDYCSYFLIRFNKQPQFCRKVEPPAVQRPTTRRAKPPRVQDEPQRDTDVDLPSTFTITRMLGDDRPQTAIPAIERKSLAGFLSNMPQEKKQLVELLYQDIVRPSGVAWEDIKGLTAAKNLLMESVIYPVRHPEVFTGLLEPWRGILLHGPPGTGKTMLARAVASESSCTFFNVSCSTIVNKWRGESEKIIKVLFEMASYYAPSIIFIDEVETIASDRSAPGEHEASRRLKAQLLTELDGISEREGIVFLLANSNMPWELDPAMLRRLEKRIYIPLPDLKTRKELFEMFLSSKTIELYPKADPEVFAAKTEGYSGSEVKLVCKEALMAAVRKLLPNMSRQSSGVTRKERLHPAEILTAIEKTKPVAKNLAQRHIDWQAQMGCS